MTGVLLIIVFGAGFGLGYAYRSRLSRRRLRGKPVGFFWFR
jgi:hypothetical protein